MEKEESVQERPEPETEAETTLPEAEKIDKSIMEKLILNCAMNRYDAILLARRWAYELKSKDQSAQAIQDLIPQAIQDVLGGKISPKAVRELPSLRNSLKKQKLTAHVLLGNIPSNPPEAEEEEKSAKAKKKS